MTTETGQRERPGDDGPVKSWTPKATLIVLGLLTLAYLVGLFLLISRIAPCEDLRISSYWLLRPVDRYVQCRDINELGDALAGAFAPLAFLWLAGAVFIQSRELAAQRKELQLARDEARQTREVMKEQAAESRASTAFIGKQTEILEREQVQRDQQLANRQFDQLLEAHISTHRRRPVLAVICTVRSFIGPVERHDPPKWSATGTAEPVADAHNYMGLFLANLRTAKFDLQDKSRNVKIQRWNEADFDADIEAMRELFRMVPLLSPDHNIYASRLKLSKTISALEAVKAHLIKLTTEQTPG